MVVAGAFYSESMVQNWRENPVRRVERWLVQARVPAVDAMSGRKTADDAHGHGQGDAEPEAEYP